MERSISDDEIRTAGQGSFERERKSVGSSEEKALGRQ